MQCVCVASNDTSVIHHVSIRLSAKTRTLLHTTLSFAKVNSLFPVLSLLRSSVRLGGVGVSLRPFRVGLQH